MLLLFQFYGGKIFIGIEDKTNEVIGIGEKNPFRLADGISNMIFDSCTPIIDPEITIQTLEGRTVVVVEVFSRTYASLLSQVIWEGTRFLYKNKWYKSSC